MIESKAFMKFVSLSFNLVWICRIECIIVYDRHECRYDGGWTFNTDWLKGVLPSQAIEKSFFSFILHTRGDWAYFHIIYDDKGCK